MKEAKHMKQTPKRGTKYETTEDKILRLEKQIRRWRKKNAAANKEIDRLEAHVDRGRGLLHQVTSQMGGKQLERDLATARLEAAMSMMVCLLEGVESVYIPLDTFRAVIGKKRVDMEQVEGGYRLKIVEITEENGGATDGETTDTVPLVVPASDEEGNPGQPGPDILPESQPSIPTDQ